MNDILSLKGKAALITGAGQGIGRQIALHFAAHGCANVLVNDFFPERAKAVADEVTALGSKGIALPFDVTDFAGVCKAVEEAAASAGGLHILVNNAGNAGPTGDLSKLPPFWETGPDDWERWMGTNLFGVLNVCRAAIPIAIRSGGGSIVNVISDAGRVGEPHLVVYSAAKAGAGGLSRALAKALGRHAIRVNSVSLGGVRTPGLKDLQSDEAAVKKSLSSYIVRRLGEPEDAANMVLFLASDAASWITGQTIGVNGGYSTSQ